MNSASAQSLVESVHDAASKQTDSNAIGEPFMQWSDVAMHRAVFEGDSHIEMVVGTNAPQFTDNVAQTVVMLHDLDGAAIRSVRVMVKEDGNMEPCGLLLVVDGDSEARTLADAFEYAAKVIKNQIKSHHAAEG